MRKYRSILKVMIYVYNTGSKVASYNDENQKYYKSSTI